MAKENHILVGLGGTGGKVLKAFRKRLYQEYNAEERSQLPIGFLYVDSSIEMMKADDKTWQVLGENAQFGENEFVNVKGIDLNAVLAAPSSYPGLKGIIGDAEVMRRTLGEVGAAAAQKRRAGRILFGSNIDKFKQALINQFKKVNEVTKASRTNIYIFTGLAGGTGSGSIIDVIAQTRMIPQFRQELSQDGKTGTAIVVNAMVPELAPPGTSDAGRYHANGYAALQELNALLSGNFKPYDVSGKGQSERLNLDLVNKVADGLILYSNVNEHGYTVESLHELPQILADFTYSRIFLEVNDNTEEFLRSYSYENINDWRVEYYEKAKNGAIQPYRTKAVSSFGFKRVIIPEEEIIEYFSFSFGRQSLLQMRFNNWNDDLGYRDTPANEDYSSEVMKADLQEKWRISDKHLMLELPILPSDENKFGAFAPYWAGVIPRWAQDAERANQPLAKLEELCEKGYNELFRQLGAVRFYEGKNAAREQHAQEICDRIEHYIFDQWKMGDLSLYNMLQLIDCIQTEVGRKRKNMEAKAQSARQLTDQLIQQREQNKKAFAGVLVQSLVKGKYLTRHSTVLQQLMVKRCEVLGAEFAQQMTAALSVKLNLLRNRIETFVSTLNEAIEYNEAMIGARCQDEGGMGNLQQTVIRFYDQKKVKEFTQRVITNQGKQKSIADEVRLKLVEIIGTEQTFQHANAVIDKDTIAGLMDTVVRQKSIAIHDDMLIEVSEKLINRNILEQLSERYSENEELKKFAKSIIEESGVFLEFNGAELQRSIGGMNAVPEQGTNINRKIVLIQLPKVEGNETVQKFATKLKAALESAVAADIHVKVDMSGSRQNELTVQAITYCFPIRCLKNLAFYKERYDHLVNGNEGRQMRTVLHSEGTGDDFPTLEVQGELLGSQLREVFMPYAIADYALDYIKYGDLADGTGRKAYGTVTKDPLLGLETLKPLADKFTGIGYSPAFTEDFGEELKDKYEEVASTTLMNIELRKQTMIPKVQQLLGQVVLPECGGNQGSPEFLEFVGWTKKALAMIQDPTPIKRKNAQQQGGNIGGIDFSSLLS